MLTQLKRWLNKPNNSNTKLAYLLGYKSGSTISNWITRKSIPEYIKPLLKEILKRSAK